MNDLYKQGEVLLRLAEREASNVQVHISSQKQHKLELVANKTDSFMSSDNISYAVMVYIDGKAGMSVSNMFSPAVVERALSVAKASAKCEYFYGLPAIKKTEKPQLYDKQIAVLDENKIVDMADELMNEIASKTVALSTGSLTKSIAHDAIFTSEGIQHTEQSTSLGVVAECIASKGDKVKSAWDYRHERKLFPIKPFASRVRKKADFFMNSSQLTEKPEVVILKPEPFAELLEHAFLPNLNGKNIEKGKSCLNGKIGRQILSPIISIHDNPLLNFGINSRAMDAEGTPSRCTTLFNKGILKNFIYDYNTAMHSGVSSTGNGGFSSIDFTNVVVEGDYKDIDKALVIDSVIGAHTADETATDFSVTVDRAYILHDGEKKPVTGFMISGKMLEVLQKALSVGKKQEAYNGIYTGAIATDGVNIIL